MKTSAISPRPWATFLLQIFFLRPYSCINCAAYAPASRPSLTTPSAGSRPLRHSDLPSNRLALPSQWRSCLSLVNSDARSKRRRSYPLKISSVDMDVPKDGRGNDANQNNDINSASGNLLSWRDLLSLSLYTTACALGALIISTYEDFDVTHTRPSPSTLRVPPVIFGKANTSPWRNRHFNFLGAATRGMGWGAFNRGIIQGSANTERNYFFEDWYGTSATTLQWKPSYNEIMLQHRSERVPRWNELAIDDRFVQSSMSIPSSKLSKSVSKEELQQAVVQLYQSLKELDELKAMADDYMWEEMKERLRPTANTLGSESRSAHSLPLALEYSMDVLKSTPSSYASITPSKYDHNSKSKQAPSKYDHNSKSKQAHLPNDTNVRELPNLIGFDWGSCAWRHCGAKADAQEAIAELYSSVGMLEPFECRFILDILERSIRDVISVVPDDLKPLKNGTPIQVKPYEPYVSRAENDQEMGLDYEYTQALSDLRVDLSLEE